MVCRRRLIYPQLSTFTTPIQRPTISLLLMNKVYSRLLRAAYIRLPLFLFLVFCLFSLNRAAAQCPITVDAGPDQYLCAPPQPTQLDGSIGGDYLNFTWSPSSGLSGANTLSPTATVTQNTSYVLTARTVQWDNNLITNGDFEGGNFGFTSDYIYNPGDLVPEGYYDVIPNPQSDHPGFAPCTDHTSGGGNMMVVNGAGTPGLNVWCQTVNVTPNTQYAFSAWVTTVVAASPARLQFSINGATIGPIFTAPGSTCVWINFYTLWNSGPNSTATICIVNQNTVLGGNDFALDDIVFAPTCLVTDTVTLHVVNVNAVASPPVSVIPCDGASITLSGNGSSTGTNVSYSWDTPNGNIVSGGNTLTPIVNAAGSYTLTVAYNAPDGTVCEKTATVNVIESPTPLAASILPPQPLGCGGANTILLGSSSQPAFSIYSWSTTNGHIVSGQGTKNATVDQPGDYTLLVTNTQTGCTATASVTVTTATNIPLANAQAGTPITCAQMQSPLSSNGSSTGANINYSWTTTGSGVIIGASNGPTATAGAAGTYYLNVTNTTNNCTSADTVVVTADLVPPTPFIQPPGVLNCSVDTLPLSATVNPPNSTFTWVVGSGAHIASGATTLTPLVDAPGAYALNITNPANGCTATAVTVVPQNITPPLAMIQPADSITCQQTTVTLSGMGSSMGSTFHYVWTAGPGGNIVSGDTTLTPVVNAPALYTLLITNFANTCTDTAHITVVADANIVIAVANSPDTLDCQLTSLQLNTNGSSTAPTLTYLWTTPNGNIVSGDSTATPLIDAPGSYQLLITNTANGCTGTDGAIVLEDLTPPDLSVASTPLITCANPQQTIQGQNSLPGNFTYLWSASNGGNILNGDSTLAPTVNAAGTYSLVATNLHNQCTAQLSTDVQVEVGTPVAIALAPSILNCNQSSVQLDGSGSSSGPTFLYAWSALPGGAHIVSGSTSPQPMVDQPGDYSLQVTNMANGCVALDTVSLSQDIVAPTADAGPAGLLTCTDPVFTLTANGGMAPPNLAFHWQTTDGHLVGDPDLAQVNADQMGSYSLLVTNLDNGCTSTSSALIDANQQAPGLSIAAPEVLTCTLTQTPLSATASGNTLSYQWQTSDGQIVSGATTSTATVDAPGLYNLTVIDGVNGCTSTSSSTVLEDIAAPNLGVSPAALLTCAAPTQVLQADNFSLPGNFTYAWTAAAGGNIVSGDDGLNPTVNAGGDYVLTVSNTDNGCSSTINLSVMQNTVLPTASAGPDDTLSCSINSLTLNGSASGNGALTYTWTASNGGSIVSGNDTPAPVIDAPGTYDLLVTNTANGCTATDVLQILNDANAPVANAGPPAELTCALTQTNLAGTGSSGPTFSYAWTTLGGGSITGGANTLTPTIDAPGQYQLAVTNSANGCTSTATVTVTENIQPPDVSVGAAAVLTCTTTSLPLSSSATGGSNLSFSWQTSNGHIVSGANTPAPIIDQSGSYALSVTNPANGCGAAAVVFVSIDTLHPVVGIAAPGMLTCTTLTTPLSASVLQVPGAYTLNWTTNGGHFVSGQNSLTPTVDDPGPYFLSVQNSLNGCTGSAQTTVGQDIQPPVANAGATDTLNCFFPQLSLDGSQSSTGVGFTYLWSASNGGAIVNGQTTLAPTVDQPGNYALTVTDTGNGCTAASTVSISKNTTPPPVALAQPSPLTCIQHSVSLNAAGSANGAGFSMNWATGNGHFVGSPTGLTPQVDAAGSYTLTIQNLSTGCSATATATVGTDYVFPGADAGPDGELHCHQLLITLSGTSPTPGNLLYQWTTADGHLTGTGAAAAPQADAPGTYTLVVTKPSNGCTSQDIAVVSAIPPPDFVPEAQQPSCLQPRGSLLFEGFSGGALPFSFSINGGTSFQSAADFENLQPGAYDLVLRDAKGCTATSTVELFAPMLPTVSLPDYLIVELGDSVQLKPSAVTPVVPIASWVWTPSEGLSCADCPEPWAKPFTSQVYKLSVTDENGCTAQIDVLLRLNKRRNLYAPNIFTPNGDGVNDFFTLYGKGVTVIHNLRIFDRWGNQLFQAKDIQPNDESVGWDGSFRGQPMNPAVFVWEATVEFIDGQSEVFAGDVTVDR